MKEENTYRFLSNHKSFIDQKFFSNMKNSTAATDEELSTKSLINSYRTTLESLESDLELARNIICSSTDGPIVSKIKQIRAKSLESKKKYPTEISAFHWTVSLASSAIVGAAVGYLVASFPAGFDMNLWSQVIFTLAGSVAAASAAPATLLMKHNFKKAYNVDKVQEKKYSIERVLTRFGLERYKKKEETLRKKSDNINTTKMNCKLDLETLLSTQNNPFLVTTQTGFKFLNTTKTKLSKNYDYLRRWEKKQLTKTIEHIKENKRSLAELHRTLSTYQNAHQPKENVITPIRNSETQKTTVSRGKNVTARRITTHATESTKQQNARVKLIKQDSPKQQQSTVKLTQTGQETQLVTARIKKSSSASNGKTSVRKR